MNPTKPLKPTTPDQLKQIAKGEVVALPGFTDEAPFVARLRRPSLLQMAAGGVIPNPLMPAALELFDGKQTNGKPDSLKTNGEMLTLIAQCALVEPSFETLAENDVQLTDVQLLSIYHYAVSGRSGVKQVESFRTES